MNDHEWECDCFWGSSSLLSSPNLLLCKSWVGSGGTVGCCWGTDSGTSASPPSYPVFPLSMNVMNECCMKSIKPRLCVGNSLSWELLLILLKSIHQIHYWSSVRVTSSSHGIYGELLGIVYVLVRHTRFSWETFGELLGYVHVLVRHTSY